MVPLACASTHSAPNIGTKKNANELAGPPYGALVCISAVLCSDALAFHVLAGHIRPSPDLPETTFAVHIRPRSDVKATSVMSADLTAFGLLMRPA